MNGIAVFHENEGCCSKEKNKVHEPSGHMYMPDISKFFDAKTLCKNVKKHIYINWDNLENGYMVSYPSLEITKRSR